MPNIILLTRGMQTFVDEEDYSWLSQWRWHASRGGGGGGWYAARTSNKDGIQHYVSMHRFIMNPPQDMIVDHINGDTLNNRRENLRIVTHKGNQQAAAEMRRKNTGAMPGIYFDRRDRVWVCRFYVGRFQTREEARHAAQEAHVKIFGPESGLGGTPSQVPQ